MSRRVQIWPRTKTQHCLRDNTGELEPQQWVGVTVTAHLKPAGGPSARYLTYYPRLNFSSSKRLPIYFGEKINGQIKINK
jgi:hypothetical protein